METYLFHIIEPKFEQSPYGFNTQFCYFKSEQFLCDIRLKKFGPWILLKILEVTKHKKLIFLYMSENQRTIV